MMFYLLESMGAYSVFTSLDAIPEHLRKDAIEVESLPEGYGVLRRADDGTFYYEQPVAPEPPTNPIPPVEPEESVNDKLARLEEKLEMQNIQTLTIMDINLTLYEEVLSLREELAKTNGTI